MKLIAPVKLLPNPEPAQALRETIPRVNSACAYIADCAWTNQTFGRYRLQRQVYRDVRERFGLSAQLAGRAIAKVADAYQLDKQRPRTFQPLGASTYDDRILSWKLVQARVSINTVHGRLKIPFVCGEHQRDLLQSRQGEADLVYRAGAYYLFATWHVDEPTPAEFGAVLGVDLGIVNIAADSDGAVYSGAQVNGLRHRHRRLRQRLQQQGTKAARRRLKQRGRQEHRLAHHENQRIAKELVRKAQDPQRAIALEDLTGIRARTTVSQAHRAAHDSWSFYDLRQKIEYKARRAGVTVLAVDPRHTSCTCPQCGLVSPANRRTPARFVCVSCGFSGPADTIAAGNIARRASVNAPYVSTTRFSPAPAGVALVASGTSPLL